MSILELGAIADFVGAVAVLATLIYLALQIRQSNTIASWETHRSAVTANTSVLNELIANEDAARIYRSGLLDIDALNEVERIQFHMILQTLTLHFKDTLDARDKGFFDEPTYEAWEGYLCSLLNMPGGEVWWRENKNAYIGRVREVVDAAKPLKITANG
jgi:hypothetical protein